MPSAPEHADIVVAMAKMLSPDARRALAFKWIDRTTREHCANAVARLGYEDFATRLRELSELRDRAACVEAKRALKEVARFLGGEGSNSEPHVNAVACVCGIIVVIDQDLKDSGPDLHGLIVGTLTSARCAGAYDEERLQIADVEEARIAAQRS